MLPLSKAKGLFPLAAALGVLAVLGELADLEVLANFAKLAAVTFFAFWFLRFFEELVLLVIVALIIPWVDAYSVFRGPTGHIVSKHPHVFTNLSFAFPLPDGQTRAARAARPALLRALPRRRLPVPAARRLDVVRDGRVPRRHRRARAVDDAERPAGATRDLARVPAPERRPALGAARRWPRARPRTRRCRRRGARSSSATDSTCGVCGNMSTGLRAQRVAPLLDSSFSSPASVVGLQET